jgi:hypothetical protein
VQTVRHSRERPNACFGATSRSPRGLARVGNPTQRHPTRRPAASARSLISTSAAVWHDGIGLCMLTKRGFQASGIDRDVAALSVGRLIYGLDHSACAALPILSASSTKNGYAASTSYPASACCTTSCWGTCAVPQKSLFERWMPSPELPCSSIPPSVTKSDLLKASQDGTPNLSANG